MIQEIMIEDLHREILRLQEQLAMFEQQNMGEHQSEEDDKDPLHQKNLW